MKVTPQNRIELDKMRRAGELAARVIDHVTPYVEPGVSTEKLNQICHEFTEKHGGVSAPLNYKGFPKSICTSINDVVCHGIPSEADILKEGDIVNLDITVILDGFHGDTSRMFGVGKISEENANLIKRTHEAMMKGIETIRSGSYLLDIGKAIQPFAEGHGYGVVKEYCGHGIGKLFHSDPAVLHYDPKDEQYNLRLKRGMTFTVEPMINLGSAGNHLEKDGWTVRTNDGKNSAQFEHTLAVTEDGVEIFTKSPKGWDCWPYC